MSFELMSILNLCDGEVVTRFNTEMQKVIENIQDCDKPATKKRSITIKFTFEPDEQRTDIVTMIESSSKLVADAPSGTMVKIHNRHAIVSTGQMPLFKDANVTELDQAIGDHD